MTKITLPFRRYPLNCVNLLLFLVGISIGPFVQAQQAASESNDDDEQLDEIVVRGHNYVRTEVTVGKGLDSLQIPQTVNVITQQRIEDQNLTSLPDIMRQATGATVVAADGAGLNTYYYARGYFIDTILLDGLPEVDPIGSGFSTAFDSAIYERVEMLKGPSGLYIGAGEPGALLSLVRKRARRQADVSGVFNVGSWDRYRAQIDVTGGLYDSGRLRGRVVAVYDEGDSFRDVVAQERAQIYGTLEFDLTPQTVLTTSITHQDIESVMDYGLPAFADGTLLDVSRSTFIGADWNQLDPRMTDMYLGLEHSFADGSFLKLAGRYFDRRLFGVGAFAQTPVDPVTGTVDLFTLGFTSERDGSALDVYYDKPFELGGLEHNLVVGLDYRQSEDTSIFRGGATLTQDVFDPDHALPGPTFNFEVPLSPEETEQTGIYSQLRVGLPGAFRVVLGGRLTWWETQVFSAASGEVTSENSIDEEFTPYAAVLWQGSDSHTLYASYAEIFKPQDDLTIQEEPLPPRTGRQFEIGIKGQYLDGLVVGHAAVYRIQDRNRAIPDLSAPPGIGAALPAGEVRSDGFEIELSGEVLPRLNLTAGYAYVDTEFEEAPVGEEGQTFSTITPEHNFNLWANYQLPFGPLEDLDLGLGIRSVSSFYSERNGVRFEADGFTTVQARIGYAFSERLSVSLIGNNLFDEDFYEKVESAVRQNYFGAPRNVTLVLNARL